MRWQSFPYRRAAVTASLTLLALALPAPAGASNDSCTKTLSNPGSSTGSSVRDVMCGTDGDDTLSGLSGDDELRGFGGNDTLTGGTGDDELFGASGFDTLKGQGGNDLLHTRDGFLDATVDCGPGQDTAVIDLVDFSAWFNFLIGAAGEGVRCETVSSGAVNEGPTVVIASRGLRAGREGRTRARLSCPPELPRPCAGRLRLRQLRSGPAGVYSIEPGETESVAVSLSRPDRLRLRRRGRVDAALTSVEQGDHGQKTAFQRVTVRLRS